MENKTFANVKRCNYASVYKNMINIYQNNLNNDVNKPIKDEIEYIFKEFVYNTESHFYFGISDIKDYFTKELTNDINNDLINLNMDEKIFEDFCDSMKLCHEAYHTKIHTFEIIYDNNKYHMLIKRSFAECITTIIIMDDNKNITTGKIYETMIEFHEADDGVCCYCKNADKIMTLLFNSKHKNEILEKLKHEREEIIEKDDIIMNIVKMYS